MSLLCRTVDGVREYFGWERLKHPHRFYTYRPKLHTGEPISITSDPYWRPADDRNLAQIPKLKREIEAKLKELKELRDKRQAKLTEFKKISQSIKRSINAIKFSDPFEKIDSIFNAIIRKQFDLSVCQSIKEFLNTNIAKIKALKTYAKEKAFQAEQLPNKIFSVLPVAERSKQAGRLIKSSGNKLREFNEWLRSKSALEWGPTESTSISIDTASNFRATLRKMQLMMRELDLMKEFQKIERESFILKQRDTEYSERIEEIDSQIKVYDYFIADIRRNGNIRNHLHKQSERIKRLSQIYRKEDVEANLFEAWHRRNLLEMYTNTRLIKYDKLADLCNDLSWEFKKNFKAFWSDGKSAKEMYDVLSASNGSKMFTIDAALINLFKLNGISENATKVKEFVEKGFSKVKIYPDSIVFSVAAIYNQLRRSKTEEQMAMMSLEWPNERSETYLKHK